MKQSIGDAFGVVVEWIEKAVKWGVDLINPTNESAENLDKAAEAGKGFGLAFATAIDTLTTPLQWLMDSLKWIAENIPSWDDITKGTTKLKNYVSENATQIGNYASEKWQNTKNFFGFGKTEEPQKKWSGGFTGHSGKYEPAGIVHRGEYVMTKEATARLGVANLNRLNYGGVLGMVAMASKMAMAHPMPAIKVDNRPTNCQPIAKCSTTVVGQSEHDVQIVAQSVNRKLALITHNVKEFERVQDLIFADWQAD